MNPAIALMPFLALAIRKLKTEFFSPFLPIVWLWVLDLPLCPLIIPSLFFLFLYFFHTFILLFKIACIYFKREGKRGRKKGRETSMCERNIDRLPLATPQLGNRPATQTCALTRNRTGDLSLWETMPNPLSHTSQGYLPLYLSHPYPFWACSVLGFVPSTLHTLSHYSPMTLGVSNLIAFIFWRGNGGPERLSDVLRATQQSPNAGPEPT